jgi:DNA-binding response OmpR family regulator
MARILVIDDEPDMRAFLEEIPKSNGYEVILAARPRPKSPLRGKG